MNWFCKCHQQFRVKFSYELLTYVSSFITADRSSSALSAFWESYVELPNANFSSFFDGDDKPISRINCTQNEDFKLVLKIFSKFEVRKFTNRSRPGSDVLWACVQAAATGFGWAGRACFDLVLFAGKIIFVELKLQGKSWFWCKIWSCV